MSEKYEIHGYIPAGPEDEIIITIENYQKGNKLQMTTFLNSFSMTTEHEDGVWDLTAKGVLKLLER